MPDDEPVELPIDGVLDLHTFRPADVRELLPDYITACLERGIHDLRIVHGKGTGQMRSFVHAQLRKDPRVEWFGPPGDGGGGWGATIVRLGMS